MSGQATQVAIAVAPVLVEYVPAAHSVHAALPVAILYLPVVQVTHGPPSGPVCPGRHRHAAAAVLRAGELAPLIHAVHALAPADHDPASHSIISQVSTDVLATTEENPVGQAVHVV